MEWINWSGGECPIPEGTIIDVRYRNGEETHSRGCETRWTHDWTHFGLEDDIIAYRIVEQPAQDGWINWSGDGCPVPTGTIVDVRHRNGNEFFSVKAGLLGSAACDWRDDNSPRDIIAYRIVEQPAQDGWINWSGDGCPVPTGTIVDVRHRNGNEFFSVKAGLLGSAACDWRDDNSPRDIIAYRIVEQPSTEPAATTVQVGGDHYKKLGIQPIEYIAANNLGFCEGNVVKYVSRWKDKNGLQDLEKAKHYIELLIEMEKKYGRR